MLLLYCWLCTIYIDWTVISVCCFFSVEANLFFIYLFLFVHCKFIYQKRKVGIDISFIRLTPPHFVSISSQDLNIHLVLLVSRLCLEDVRLSRTTDERFVLLLVCCLFQLKRICFYLFIFVHCKFRYQKGERLGLRYTILFTFFF